MMRARLPIQAVIVQAALLLGAFLGLAAVPGDAGAQVPGRTSGSTPVVGVRFALPDGTTPSVQAQRHRGYPAIPARVLEPLGWHGSDRGDLFVLRHRTGLELRFRPGSPFLQWEGDPVQMVNSPYRLGEHVYVPLQLVVDLLPAFLPDAYQWNQETRVLQVEGASLPGQAVPSALPAQRPEERDGTVRTLVVIDPGHGGHDTGAVGPTGIREKDVALAFSRALARELEADSTLEVRLTRDADEFVPLWERGALATRWKGERPGVFLSIHANALPDRPDVRGFETYFLAEARTEHERRVAAAENAPLALFGDDEAAGAPEDPLLADILRDLRTFDHQHWSALLAELVQQEIARVHPGSDRGVKQGPFAVITNSLMPSVLIEVGFVTHRDEEQLLTRPGFHRDTARAIAASVEEFLRRYPPRPGSAASSSRRSR